MVQVPYCILDLTAEPFLELREIELMSLYIYIKIQLYI